MSAPAGPLRVAIVAPVMVKYDAISASVRDTMRALAGDRGFTPMFFGCTCDYCDVVFHRCRDVSDLLIDPDYLNSDIAIFHFGMYNNLFDALAAGGPPIRIVHFHNVTPACFVSEADRPAIARSLAQIDVLRRADEIWADSPTNARELLDRGFDPARIQILPIVVDKPAPANLADKAATPIELLYIGRIVPAKGLHDLVSAIAGLDLAAGTVRVSIVGNTAWSETSYLEKIRAQIGQHGLGDVVRFVGTVDDAERERLFHAAHILVIPSYHEGFCRPVVEGLRTGCVPVVYDGYNLPHIAAGLGRVVPTGDVPALTAAIRELVNILPTALAQPEAVLLDLDVGKVSIKEFTRLAQNHTAAFAFDAIGTQIRQRLLRIAGRG